MFGFRLDSFGPISVKPKFHEILLYQVENLDVVELKKFSGQIPHLWLRRCASSTLIWVDFNLFELGRDDELPPVVPSLLGASADGFLICLGSC